eukprot:scaffold6981_cov118-Skeletonema_dohrnii-CCMP3373.AAC.4
MEERGDGDDAHHDGKDYVDDATFLHGWLLQSDNIILSLVGVQLLLQMKSPTNHASTERRSRPINVPYSWKSENSSITMALHWHFTASALST